MDLKDIKHKTNMGFFNIKFSAAEPHARARAHTMGSILRKNGIAFHCYTDDYHIYIYIFFFYNFIFY